MNKLDRSSGKLAHDCANFGKKKSQFTIVDQNKEKILQTAHNNSK